MQKPIPAFLLKLREMVDEGNCIEWNSEGTSFVVTDQLKFCQKVLPKYFKHNNFTSFIRQLNMYGFKKLPTIRDSEFMNEFFVRSDKEKMHEIQRRQKHEEFGVKDILQELHEIKAQQLELNQEILKIKMENTEMYRQSLNLQQQYYKQKDTIDKILQFLAGVYSKNELESLKKQKLLDGQVTVGGHEEGILVHKPADSYIKNLDGLNSPLSSITAIPSSVEFPMVSEPSANNNNLNSENMLFSMENSLNEQDNLMNKNELLGQQLDLIEDRIFDIKNNHPVKDEELNFDDFFTT